MTTSTLNTRGFKDDNDKILFRRLWLRDNDNGDREDDDDDDDVNAGGNDISPKNHPNWNAN